MERSFAAVSAAATRWQAVLNWLALAMLLGLGIVAAPAPEPKGLAAGHARGGARALEAAPPPAQKALRPVSVRPMVSWWIVSVPS